MQVDDVFTASLASLADEDNNCTHKISWWFHGLHELKSLQRISQSRLSLCNNSVIPITMFANSHENQSVRRKPVWQKKTKAAVTYTLPMPI